MSGVRSILMVALLASSASGCGTCGSEAESAEEQASAREAVPAGEQVDLPVPTVEQLPLAQDFALHAGQRVTEETYRAELERLEQELGPIPEAEPAQGDALPATDTAAR